MGKWEYLFVDSLWDIRCGHSPVSANRQKLKLEDDVCVDAYANKLGEEGWELVSVVEVGNMMRLFFKRPKDS